MLLGQVIGGELDESDAFLEFSFITRRPVNADIELDALELGTVVDLNVRVVGGGVEDWDNTLGDVLELLVDEVQDQNLDLGFL
jgi:hypothetical protein